MLLQLSIRNFAVVKSLDIDLKSGLTAITGETGAGKSIAIDALGLCLGDRAEASMVRAGSNKADVSACFDVTALPKVTQWLVENELMDDEPESPVELMIRRVISAEGRSKAYLNGVSVSLQQLKSLAGQLVNIHGQHAHQQLLKGEYQRHMLDRFAEHSSLLLQVKQQYQSLNTARQRYEELQLGQQGRADRKQLLEYQVQELDEFALGEEEFLHLEAEQKRLSHSQTLLEQSQKSVYMLYESEEVNALDLVKRSVSVLAELREHDEQIAPMFEILNEAMINIEEAASQLRDYAENLELDPERIQQVEERYSQAMDLARKHQVKPEDLYNHHQELVAELASLNSEDGSLAHLELELERLEQGYLSLAKQLSESRRKAAKTLSKQIETHIHDMNMAQAKMDIRVEFDSSRAPASHGLDKVTFCISTNPGVQADTLDKVVSGGELSRIGLACQVISAKGNQIPTMIFDEVDTGISGSTASVVGKLLRKLGESCQVMCVTHLPQVAARAHQQMFVTKFSDKKTTETHMINLNQNERIEELARLLAGDTLTESAIANAKELLSLSE
jgi:DNA repair protein RecN (Recombination protein N)